MASDLSQAFLRQELTHSQTLPPQLWIDWDGTQGEPSESRMKPPGDGELAGRPAGGGLWTSTWQADTEDSPYLAAIRVSLQRQRVVERPAWILYPRESIVWEIRDRSAEWDLAVIAPGRPVWAQVARTAHAAHMTAEGSRAFARMPPDPGISVYHEHRKLFELRLRAGAAMDHGGYACPLDWWEAESTYWMTWRFDRVERVADIRVPLLPD